MTSADQERFVALSNVSRETFGALQEYAGLLERWNATINLVSKATIDKLWSRHFLDSAQLLDLVEPQGKWVDLGSGGGFPGLVVAILSRPNTDLEVTMVEADQRKAAFLRTVVRELDLKAHVVVERIEEASPMDADILSARALAPLEKLLEFTQRHRKPSGVAIFPKGEKAEIEIAEALERWAFDCEKHPSQTDSNSTILRIGEIKSV